MVREAQHQVVCYGRATRRCGHVFMHANDSAGRKTRRFAAVDAHGKPSARVISGLDIWLITAVSAIRPDSVGHAWAGHGHRMLRKG